jgi:NSS family neurotransmitter:Na+ symporter
VSTTDVETTEASTRGAFSSRRVFILAAIGSAVGLGNIWRFPYVAYEHGGGAFMIPYLVALLTAGMPFLLLDYALGHRFRGSAPLSFARLSRPAEALGWWQVAICFTIAVYYAAVIAWAVSYTGFSVTKAWGAEPDKFFFGTYLQAGDPGVEMDLVPGVVWPLVVVWIALVGIMALGVQKGVGATSVIFIPVLVVAFGFLVAYSLTLDGAMDGLNALFTPNWASLSEPGVWGAAFGQIFFSLSIGFGIMITYSSYVDRKTDMPGSPTPGSSCSPASASLRLSASWRRPPGARSRTWSAAGSVSPSSPSRRSSVRRRGVPSSASCSSARSSWPGSPHWCRCSRWSSRRCATSSS